MYPVTVRAHAGGRYYCCTAVVHLFLAYDTASTYVYARACHVGFSDRVLPASHPCCMSPVVGSLLSISVGFVASSLVSLILRPSPAPTLPYWNLHNTTPSCELIWIGQTSRPRHRRSVRPARGEGGSFCREVRWRGQRRRVQQRHWQRQQRQGHRGPSRWQQRQG